MKYLIVFCLVLLSSALLFSEDNNALPEMPVPQFNLEGDDQAAARTPANQDESKDLLSELEGLLENPAKKDAFKQLGHTEPIINPLPEIPLDKPVTKQKAVTEERSIAKEKSVVSQPKRMVSNKPAIKAKKTIERNEILSLDFTNQDQNYRLKVVSKYPLKYRTIRQNQSKQITYVFENTLAPRKLRRAFDTKEFSAPLALYTVTQVQKKKVPSVNLLLKMRDMLAPQVALNGTEMVLEFSGMKKEVAKRGVASELPESCMGDDGFDGGKAYRGSPIQKLELKDTNVQEAIRLVMRASGYNVVMGEDVKGNIGSLSLENIPWDQAFHLILQMKKLGFVRRGNLVRIASLDTLKSEQEALVKQEDMEPLKTALIPISYAKVATISARATPFLTKRGKVDTDERTNTLIIRDIESVITRIQKLFSFLDTQPPAVAISAKFVEIKKDYTKSLGLGALNIAGQTSGINFGKAQPAFPGGGFEASPQGTINISAPRFAALNAKLIIGESEKKVKVLANPTITVQQGQQGSILQGKTTDVPQAIAGNGGGATTQLTQTANLSLNVTPIVANDGSISLDTNLLQEIPQNSGTSLTKDTRQIKTQIILQNGDTAVLGGVFSGQEQDNNSGVPFLRNLPLLGYLFSSQQFQNETNEVLIFITARILNPETANKQKI